MYQRIFKIVIAVTSVILTQTCPLHAGRILVPVVDIREVNGSSRPKHPPRPILISPPIPLPLPAPRPLTYAQVVARGLPPAPAPCVLLLEPIEKKVPARPASPPPSSAPLHSPSPEAVQRFLGRYSLWHSSYYSNYAREPALMWEEASPFAKGRRSFFLSELVNFRLTTQVHQTGPWLNIDRMCDRTAAQALYAHLPPLPAHPPSLEEIGVGIASLYAHPLFAEKHRAALTSHHLEKLLNSQRIKDICPTAHRQLLQRVGRLITLVKEEVAKEEPDESYAKELFDFLYEAENTCVDNAITEIEEAERYLLYKHARTDEDFISLARIDFFNFILLALAVEKAGGDTIEAYRYLRSMCHATLQLLPSDTPGCWVKVARWKPSYSELLQEIFNRLTPEHFLFFLGATLEVPMNVRQRELHHHLGQDYLQMLPDDYEWENLSTDLPLFVVQEMQEKLLRRGDISTTPYYPMTLHLSLPKPSS